MCYRHETAWDVTSYITVVLPLGVNRRNRYAERRKSALVGVTVTPSRRKSALVGVTCVESQLGLLSTRRASAQKMWMQPRFPRSRVVPFSRSLDWVLIWRAIRTLPSKVKA